MADGRPEIVHDDSALYPNYHRMQRDIEIEMEKIDAIFAKRLSANVRQPEDVPEVIPRKPDRCDVAVGPNAPLGCAVRLASGSSSNDNAGDDEDAYLKLEGERLLMEFWEIEKCLWAQCDVLRSIEKELRKSTEKADEKIEETEVVTVTTDSAVRRSPTPPPEPTVPDCVRVESQLTQLTQLTHAERDDKPQTNVRCGTTNPVASAARDLIAEVLASKRFEVGNTGRGDAIVGNRCPSVVASSQDFDDAETKDTASRCTSEFYDDASTWTEGDNKDRRYPCDTATLSMIRSERIAAQQELLLQDSQTTVDTSRRPSTSTSDFIVYDDDDDCDFGYAEFGYDNEYDGYDNEYDGYDNSDVNCYNNTDQDSHDGAYSIRRIR